MLLIRETGLITGFMGTLCTIFTTFCKSKTVLKIDFILKRLHIAQFHLCNVLEIRKLLVWSTH